MSFNLDDANVGGQLKVGSAIVPAIGEGATRVNGSMYSEGPVVMGNPTTFPFPYATVNIAPLTNSDNKIGPLIPGALCTGVNNPYSLAVDGNAAFMGLVDTNRGVNVGQNLIAQGHVISNCGGHVLAAKKNFDIQHPSKEGWRLRHTCVEGPESAVYVRGKLDGEHIIKLPDYWKGLIDYDTISVHLTSFGRKDNLYVKDIQEDRIIIAGDHLTNVKCFYQVWADRLGELIVEYEGNSPADYPGDQSDHSIAGYTYDVRE